MNRLAKMPVHVRVGEQTGRGVGKSLKLFLEDMVVSFTNYSWESDVFRCPVEPGRVEWGEESGAKSRGGWGGVGIIGEKGWR